MGIYGKTKRGEIYLKEKYIHLVLIVRKNRQRTGKKDEMEGTWESTSRSDQEGFF